MNNWVLHLQAAQSTLDGIHPNAERLEKWEIISKIIHKTQANDVTRLAIQNLTKQMQTATNIDL